MQHLIIAYSPLFAKNAFHSSGYLLHVYQEIPLKRAKSRDVEGDRLGLHIGLGRTSCHKGSRFYADGLELDSDDYFKVALSIRSVYE
jgi:hypothetical protein